VTDSLKINLLDYWTVYDASSFCIPTWLWCASVSVQTTGISYDRRVTYTISDRLIIGFHEACSVL
jgi:hypothetical protein